MVKIVAPAYYRDFHCIAGACRHTCCVGWEVDVDAGSLARFRSLPDIAPQIEDGDPPHIRLAEGERCPFLNREGLCEMILRHGEDMLCGICRDHPRFRNFFADRVEIGLGLVCEEAARLILRQPQPMALIELSDDGEAVEPPADEIWLTDLRTRLLCGIPETGAPARLKEYLYYRHLADALYDGRVDARIAFIERSFAAITAKWRETDGSLDAMIEVVREWSYNVEYDEEELERQIGGSYENC